MIVPALFELVHDDVIAAHPSALRVYVHLVRNPFIFVRPTEVKAWLLAELLGVHRDTVNDSLTLLADRGYLLEHGRGQNNVRRLQLVIERQPGVPTGCPPNPAATPAA